MIDLITKGPRTTGKPNNLPEERKEERKEEQSQGFFSKVFKNLGFP
jgi:hypothetical protein